LSKNYHGQKLIYKSLAGKKCVKVLNFWGGMRICGAVPQNGTILFQACQRKTTGV
jgi:hypothetical protein